MSSHAGLRLYLKIGVGVRPRSHKILFGDLAVMARKKTDKEVLMSKSRSYGHVSYELTSFVVCALMLSAVTLFAEQPVLEDIIGRFQQPVDVVVTRKYQSGMIGLMETVERVRLLSPSYYDVRSSRTMIVERRNAGGSDRRLPQYERLVVADGKTIVTEESKKQLAGDEVQYKVESEPISPGLRFDFQCPVTKDDPNRMIDLFNIGFRRYDVWQGSSVCVFEGRLKNRSELPKMFPQTTDFNTIKIIIDKKKGVVYSLTILGARSSPPTFHYEIVDIKWNADLKESDFKYVEEKTTEKALKDAIVEGRTSSGR